MLFIPLAVGGLGAMLSFLMFSFSLRALLSDTFTALLSETLPRAELVREALLSETLPKAELVREALLSG